MRARKAGANVPPMETIVVERASHLRELIDTLAGVRTDAGVLSLAVGIDPGAPLGGRPAWEIQLENDLAQLVRDPAYGRAVERLLAREEALVEQLADPALPGLGRACYVPLGSETSTLVLLREPLPTLARAGRVAHLLPLLGALDAGEPAGLVTASRDALHVLETELGVVREIERFELEPWVGDWWPEMKAAARANPLRGQEVVSHRDRYQRRLAAAYGRAFADALEQVSALAGRRGWTRAVLAGDARRVEPLDEALRSLGLATAAVPANLEGVREEEALARLREALVGLVADQALARVRAAVDEAQAGGPGACGLEQVLAAAGEGRIAHLLVDPSRPFLGLVGPGETLTAAAEPEGASDLTDVLVAKVLATRGAVTPVRDDAARALAEHGGIAALLRW